MLINGWNGGGQLILGDGGVFLLFALNGFVRYAPGFPSCFQRDRLGLHDDRLAFATFSQSFHQSSFRKNFYSICFVFSSRDRFDACLCSMSFR